MKEAQTQNMNWQNACTLVGLLVAGCVITLGHETSNLALITYLIDQPDLLR